MERFCRKCVNASNPPAEAPTPTIGKLFESLDPTIDPSDGRSVSGLCAALAGERSPFDLNLTTSAGVLERLLRIFAFIELRNRQKQNAFDKMVHRRQRIGANEIPFSLR